MTYGELVNDLRYLAKVYSICENENMREYSLSIAAADAIENLDDICQHQADEIRELKNQWIPVSVRLPKEDEAVMTWGKNEIVLIDWLHDNKWCCFGEATHWMPLPEPPKEGE